MASMTGELDCIESLAPQEASATENGMQPPRNTQWTQQKVLSQLTALTAEYNGFPASCWLQANGYSGMLNWIYKQKDGILYYREQLQQPAARPRIFASRGGLVLRSWSEVSIADFLWSREIEIHQGRKYPASYASPTGRQTGWYDLEFDGVHGDYLGKRLLIEVWGDSEKHGPLGTDLDKYLQTKEQKLKFNADNPYFIGVSFQDCYKEEKLTAILQPFIGDRKPTLFQKHVDRITPSALWSTADQVLEQCRKVSEHMPDNKLPPSTWFKRKGKYADRATESWEPKSYYNIDEKICMLGGYMKIREMLGHAEHNQTLWTHDLVIRRIVEYCEKYKAWPSRIADTAERSREAKYIWTLITRHVGFKEDAFKEALQHLSQENKLPLPVPSELPKGVTLAPHSRRFQARISVNGSSVNLGVFDTVKEAEMAYKIGAAKKARGEIVASASSRYANSKSKQLSLQA